MGFKFSHLYTSPAVNPVTLKARSIPFFNPIDLYGRVFFFAWFGFMIAFWYVNSSSLCPLLAVLGAVRSTMASRLLPSLLD